MDIEDLCFGIRLFDFNSGKLKTENLFQSSRVMHSVAVWLTMPDKLRKQHDLIRFCFGDTSGHVEYEMYVRDVIVKPSERDKLTKVSVYEMYVLPNADYLTSLVNSVSVSSAKRWLRSNNR